MKNLIGVMQGRLLPKYLGRYQAHPLGYWQDEFQIAKDAGLDCIEFILDFNDADKNPLLEKDGVKEIQKITEKTGVKVKTICADYFMEAPLHSTSNEVSEKSIEILKKLLVVSSQLDITDIVIPCVDQSSLNGDADCKRFVSVIKNILADVELAGVNLSLETDLAPVPFKKLLSQINSNNITVN